MNDYPIWYSSKGEKITCLEKIKVMEQNIEELRQIAQDAFEDGILMGINPEQLRLYLMNLIENLFNPYEKG